MLPEAVSFALVDFVFVLRATPDFFLGTFFLAAGGGDFCGRFFLAGAFLAGAFLAAFFTVFFLTAFFAGYFAAFFLAADSTLASCFSNR